MFIDDYIINKTVYLLFMQIIESIFYQNPKKNLVQSFFV